jgi:hypothetical protein
MSLKVACEIKAKGKPYPFHPELVEGPFLLHVEIQPAHRLSK